MDMLSDPQHRLSFSTCICGFNPQEMMEFFKKFVMQVLQVLKFKSKSENIYITFDPSPKDVIGTLPYFQVMVHKSGSSPGYVAPVQLTDYIWCISPTYYAKERCSSPVQLD